MFRLSWRYTIVTTGHFVVRARVSTIGLRRLDYGTYVEICEEWRELVVNYRDGRMTKANFSSKSLSNRASDIMYIVALCRLRMTSKLISFKCLTVMKDHLWVLIGSWQGLMKRVNGECLWQCISINGELLSFLSRPKCVCEYVNMRSPEEAKIILIPL